MISKVEKNQENKHTLYIINLFNFPLRCIDILTPRLRINPPFSFPATHMYVNLYVHTYIYPWSSNIIKLNHKIIMWWCMAMCFP